jgi:hypothetical protein
MIVTSWTWILFNLLVKTRLYLQQISNILLSESWKWRFFILERMLIHIEVYIIKLIQEFETFNYLILLNIKSWFYYWRKNKWISILSYWLSQENDHFSYWNGLFKHRSLHYRKRSKHFYLFIIILKIRFQNVELRSWFKSYGYIGT